jgi:hypothetical protein
MADNPKKKKRRKVKGNKMNGQTVVSTSEDQSLGGQVQSDIAVVEALSSTSKKTAKTTKSRVHTSENTPHDAVKSQKRPRTSITDNSKVSDEAAPSRMDDDESSPRSSKKSKYKHKNSENLENGVTDPIDDNQADGRTKGPEDSQRHTPSIGQVDPLETVSTRPPQEMKKSRKKKEVAMTDKEPNDALSAPISATSDSTIVVKRAKSMF